MSFRNVIEGTGLTIEACADVLGVDRELFQQWSDGQKEIPPAYAVLLAAIFGVRSEILLQNPAKAQSMLETRVPPQFGSSSEVVHFMTPTARQSCSCGDLVTMQTSWRKQFEEGPIGHGKSSLKRFARGLIIKPRLKSRVGKQQEYSPN